MLFIFTTYYFQINDFSKRINQIIEITIRFLINIYSNINFVLTLGNHYPDLESLFELVKSLRAAIPSFNAKNQSTLQLSRNMQLKSSNTRTHITL